MIAPEITETRPRLRDPSTVVAVVAIREAVRQWPAASRQSLVGSYDTRPLPVTVRPETDEEAGWFPSMMRHAPGGGRWLRLLVHHGPGGIMNSSGRLDPAPVEEELAAFEAFERSKRWSSREGLEPGSRILSVVGWYRGDEADFHFAVSPRDLDRWRGAEERGLWLVVEGMNAAITRLVLARIAGPEVLEMMGENA